MYKKAKRHTNKGAVQSGDNSWMSKLHRKIKKARKQMM